MRNQTEPWVIVGGGPVGEMQAVLLGAIFPDQNIHIIDKVRDIKRQHGLLIWPETIEHIVHQLGQIRNHLISTLEEEPEPNTTHTRVEKIDETIDFLNKNFLQNRSGTFIPTQTLIEKLRSLSNSRSNIHYILDEVTPTRLDFSEDHEITDLLKTASIIFGADGARSLIRKEIFLDPEGDESKKVEAGHILEIKLEVREKNPSFIEDQVYKTILPTLFRGNFHVWMQSKNNSATLRIFIDKEVYDKLRDKRDNKGQAYGTFTNPYRRLIDLPKQFREPIAEIISSIIGDQNINYDTIKITTLALSTFSAKRLVALRNETLYALVGDSAAGLVLARGVNNGLECSMVYASAMYYSESNEADFVETFANYEKFLQDHIDLINSYIDSLFPQFVQPGINTPPLPIAKNDGNDFPVSTEKDSASLFIEEPQTLPPNLAKQLQEIRERYLYIFNQITDHPDPSSKRHQAMVIRLSQEFENFVNKLIPNALNKEWKKKLFENLSKNTLLLENPKSEFHIAEENIQIITERNLNAIKQNTSYLGFYNRTLGHFSAFNLSKNPPAISEATPQPDIISEIKTELHTYKSLLENNELFYTQTFSAEWYYLSQKIYIEMNRLILNLPNSARGGVYLYYLDQLKMMNNLFSVTSLEKDLEGTIYSFTEGIKNQKHPYDQPIPNNYLDLLFRFVDETNNTANKHIPSIGPSRG
ncbi:FAD-dependent oxidoreductase [Legionella gresilensis]|uniref:FAD-dependent oxidoreductase n=1 Tax=Legionella gresilensis TaxID=91823 RepID=UPI001041BCC0|nr:hypothetical protein [Legionella gresilensis]